MTIEQINFQQEVEMAGAVHIKVPQLLKDRNLSPTDLMYGARIAPGTAYKLANEQECSKMTGISFDVLLRICRFLGVNISEVLEIVDNGS